jgi:hypothetical protein
VYPDGKQPLTLSASGRIWRVSRLGVVKVIAVAASPIAGGAGCGRFGYTNRVLHRLPSPDGQIVAVCQEVPVFDGPEFDVRLEGMDGRVVRPLFHMGDGGGCSEVSWSADGRILAVLTSHIAEVHVIDVEWALSHPDVQNSHWFRRDFSFASERTIRFATGLTFVSSAELEFQVCEYSMEETQRNRGQIRCSEPARRQRLHIPVPLVTNRPA